MPTETPSPDEPGGHGGLTQPVTGEDGLTTWRSARLCRIAWCERLKASDEGVYRDARNGLAMLASDPKVPHRERLRAQEALLQDQRAGEAVELDFAKIASGENRPASVTVNVHAQLTPEAVDAASALLARLGGGVPGRVDVEPDRR